MASAASSALRGPRPYGAPSAACVKVLEAGDAHKPIDIGDDILPMLVKVTVDALLEQLVRRHLRQCCVLNHEVISISCCADPNHPVQW